MLVDLAMGVLGVLLLASAWSDARNGKIPNALVYPAALAGMTLNLFQSGMTGLLQSIAGIAVGIALLLIPYVMGGMGAGDVKLMGAVGSFIGPKGALAAFVCSAFAGLIYAIIILLRQGLLGKTLSRYWTVFVLSVWGGEAQYVRPSEREQNLPPLRYAIAIAVGTAVAMAGMQAGYLGFNE